MRRAARIDANQNEIVNALRLAGVSVQLLHAVGGGCPDLLCGYRGRCYTLEVKDGAKPPSKRRLTPDQVEWHESWRGHVAVVHNVSEAFAAVGVNEADGGTLANIVNFHRIPYEGEID